MQDVETHVVAMGKLGVNVSMVTTVMKILSSPTNREMSVGYEEGNHKDSMKIMFIEG